MAVKSIVVLVMVVVLVAGLAVNGARAPPRRVTSVAFRLCQLGEQMPQPCRPIVSPERAALDDGGRDYDGGFAAGGGGGGGKHLWGLGGPGAAGRGRAAGAPAGGGGAFRRPPVGAWVSLFVVFGGRGGGGVSPPRPEVRPGADKA